VVREELGLLAPGEAPGSEQLVPARLVAGILQSPALGDVLVVSAYGFVGDGDATLGLLAEACLLREKLKLPLVMGGDYNMTPKAVRAAGILQRAHAMTAVPSRPTCYTKTSASVLDFFVVSRWLQGVIDEVTIEKEIKLATHKAVRLRFVPEPVKLKGWRLRPLERLPRQLPVGPRVACTVSWDPAAAAVEAAARCVANEDRDYARGAVAKAYELVLNALEATVAEAAGLSLARPGRRGLACKLVWVPVVPRHREPSIESAVLRPWRWLRGLPNELRELLRSDGPGGENMMRKAVLLEDFAEDVKQRMPADLCEDEECESMLARLDAIARALSQDMLLQIGDPSGRAEQLLAMIEDECAVRLRQEELSLKLDADKRWRTWAKEAVARGAARAHQWTKLPQAWRPNGVRMKDGSWSGRPTDQVAVEAVRLRGLWRSEEAPLEERPWFNESFGPDTRRIDGKMLQEASATFPVTTAETFDGLHVRTVGLLELEQLNIFANLLMLIEDFGELPEQINMLITTLIPKLKAGVVKAAFRGIGLFPATYRLWARIRRWEAAAWEAENRHEVLCYQKGRSSVECVWQQAMAAEVASYEGKSIVAFLWDMSDFFECIERERLVQRARAKSFPVKILRLSLSVYAAKR